GPPIVPLVLARRALALSGPTRTVSRCPAATRTAYPPHVAPCCSPRVTLCRSARHALLQPARRALLPCAWRPAAASASRPSALRMAPCCSQRVAPYCSQRVALYCPERRALLQPAHRALLQPARRALMQLARRTLLQPARRALLPCALRPAAASASRSAAPRVAPCCSQRVAPYCSQRVVLCCPARRTLLPCTVRALLPSPPSRFAATTAAAAAARATAATGGGTTGSAGSAAGAGGARGATGSAGGAAGAGGAGPTTDRHCLSWPPSRQLQWLGVDNGGHCLSRTTPPLSSFASGFFSKPVQRCVTGSVEAAALGASESDAALGASESATALGASESAAALGASESAAALGARASPATGPSSSEALHNFTLDSSASRCFFPVPSGSLSGLHLPTFLTNLVSNAAIPDVWVDTFIPGGQRVAICTCSQTSRHLATFTRWPGSSLYILTTASAQVVEVGQVAASSQVSASGQLTASFSCRVLSHQNLLLHHRLSHPPYHVSAVCTPVSLSLAFPGPCPPSRTRLPRRAFLASRGGSAPLLTPLSFLQPLLLCRLSKWTLGARPPVGGMDQERYFLLVVDDYTRYTTVFALQRKVDVSGVLIPCIHATRRQLCERFSRDFPVLRLHSDRGSEFSSDLLVEFCRDEGIVQSFTLPASPQQNGIAERRIGLIMEVAHCERVRND
ncbi:unnamed protein product, partial [Closterium sp. NIES-54]